MSARKSEVGAGPHPQQNPALRVVIPTVGRVDSLERCLESLTACVHGDIAVFVSVVDNSGDDHAHGRLVDLASRYNCELVVSGGGLATARQVGLGLARPGEALALVDDDEAFSASYLADVKAYLDGGNADLICGTIRVALPDGVPPWYGRTWAYGRGESSRPTITVTANSGNLLIRPAAVGQAVGVGFDSYFDWIGGEDTDFSWRCTSAGLVIMRVPGMLVTEHVTLAKCEKGVLLQNAERAAWLWSSVQRRNGSRWHALLGAARAIGRCFALMVSFWRPHPEGYLLRPFIALRVARGRVSGALGARVPSWHRTPL